MNKIKLEKLYEIIIKDLPLTKETLTIYEFTKEDINELIDENTIIEIEPNKWQLKNVNNFYKYGISLLLNKQYYKAENCFRRCYKLEPQNRKVCLQLLLLELQRKNYIAVQKLYSLLETIEPEKNKEDNKLYLLLLGAILYNNLEYQKQIKNININDIIVPNTKESQSSNKQNVMRIEIFKQKYPRAINLLNDLKREDLTYNIEYELLKELLVQALILNRKYKSKIRTAALNKDYKQIINLLKGKEKNNPLGTVELLILSITNSIIEIKRTKEIPQSTNYKTVYVTEAIKDNNFKLARKLNLKFIEKINQNKEEDVLNILLNDIINLIEEIEKEKEKLKKSEKIKKTIIFESKLKLTDEEELAYYIKEMDIPYQKAIKSMGILPETETIIKLIYARDYFSEGNYEEGYKLLQEVESTRLNSIKVIDLLNEIKETLNKVNNKTLTLSKNKY